MKPQILVIDDDPVLLDVYSGSLSHAGFSVTTASSGEEALALVRQKIKDFSVAIVDYYMPHGMNGGETIKALRQHNSKMLFVGLSGLDNTTSFEHSLEAGAVTFIEKGVQFEKITQQVKALANQYEKTNGVIRVETIPADKDSVIKEIGLVGVSRELSEVARTTLKFAPTDSTILIRGENGSGKEKIAKALHQFSSFSKGPFIAVNCGAIAENLVESELFGHEKGSFTGAGERKIGKFAAAEGGTLFLDEIGDMKPQHQVSLLRVLQEKQITPVGSNKTYKINVRVVCATNRNLENMIKTGSFREDLYHRINQLCIKVPALRDRPDDVEPLIAYFVQKWNQENNKSKSFHNNTLEILKSLTWSGNVRQLESFIEKMLILSSGDTITEDDIFKEIPTIEVANIKRDFDSHEELKKTIFEMEKQYLVKVISDSVSITDAAAKMNVSRTTLTSKLKTFGIKVKEA